MVLPLFENDDGYSQKATLFSSTWKVQSLLPLQSTKPGRYHCECCQTRLRTSRKERVDMTGKGSSLSLQFPFSIDSSDQILHSFDDYPETFAEFVRLVDDNDHLSS